MESYALACAPWRNRDRGHRFGRIVVYAIAVPGACAAQLSLEGCYVGDNARAGITNFGMSASVGTTTFECNAMDIHGQDEGTAFSFVDLGGNQCGCGGADEVCRVVGATLEPPGALASP